MAQLPEIARLTLKHTTRSGAHVEAGQLAAFAEQALPRHQRASVLEHLASCADCREVVRLCLPEPVNVLQPAVTTGRAWSFWDVLRSAPVRWAGMAATAAVVATAVWVGQLQEAPTPLPSQAQIFRAEPQIAWNGANSTPEAGAQENIAVTAQGKQPSLFDSQAITAPAGASVASSAPGASSEQNRAMAENAMRMAAAARNSGKTGPGLEAAPLAAENRAPAGSSTSSSFDNSLWATGMLTMPHSGITTHPRWMISANGILRRSLDNGVTWQDYAMQVGSRLRAVASFGDEVWVGGSNGVLYRSADAGRQWQRVIPVSAQGRAFTGDVVSIEFSDSQNGTVVTSLGDRWSTGDGGQSWQLH